jgi:hypothetical protein
MGSRSASARSSRCGRWPTSFEDGHLRLEPLVLRVDLRELLQHERDDVMLLVGFGDDVLRLLGADLLHRRIEDVLLVSVEPAS